MRDLRPFLWAFPLGGFLLILLAFYQGATPLSVGQHTNDQPAGEIRGSLTVGQTFYSPYPGLYRIDVLLATYARKNTGEVAFHLATSPRSGPNLVTIKFDASRVEDNRFRSFLFDPRGDSTGKTYFFYFESPSSGPGNAITVWSNSKNPYPDGAAYLEGQPVEADLTFIAYFRPSPWELADIYLARLAHGKPGIWGSKWFYAGMVIIYLGLAWSFLGLLFRALYRKDRGP